MSSHFVISGFPSNTQVRLEINDLIRDERQFSLYIQALRRMYDDPQTNVQSFFQVAGIHGLPFTSWDGAVGDGPLDPNAQWGGYCTHGSALFPTWHRPYVMLLEQILNRHAQEIAATYTVNQDQWREAALNLRQPYWDWARNSVPPPEVISLQRVTITASNGQRVQVDNPLVRYRFHPIDQSFPAPYSRWPATLRQPNTTASNATDDVTRMRRVLQNAQRGLTTATYSMLTRVRTWEAFSSHTVGDGGSASNSVEAIHDNIHVLVGGNGHMSDPAVAGFDPIFFLHHCNVDRLISLWSAINPGVWITRGDAQDGSFTLSVEEPVDADTPLTPFWNQQTSFWTSSDVQDMDTLGYTYPEFVGLDMSNTSAVRTAILRAVNTLYGGATARSFAASPAISLAVKPEGTQEPAAQPAAQRGSQAAFSLPTGDKPAANTNVNTSRSIGPPRDAAPAVQGNDNRLHDWIARVQFKKYEIATSFSVLLFLGDVPEDPKDWLISENLVGAHHAFVNSSAERCANCQDRITIVEEGFINLNDGIAAHSNLGSYEPRVVEPYLTRELKWRVQKVDCTPVELPSLEISVLEVPLTLSPGSEIPLPGHTHYHEGITRGQPGGIRIP